jgi:hypothetical protein
MENFLNFLDRRIMNEIFYEFREVSIDHSENFSIEIILHFLAKSEGSLMLYETKQLITKSSTSQLDELVIEALQEIFKNVDSAINLVKGKIREIFLSYS